MYEGPGAGGGETFLEVLRSLDWPLRAFIVAEAKEGTSVVVKNG